MHLHVSDSGHTFTTYFMNSLRFTSFCFALWAVHLTGCEESNKVEVSDPAVSAAAENHKIDTVKVANVPEMVTFNEHVQPILSEYCYHCHGPDAGTRAPEDAPLRLDIESEAFAHRSKSKYQAIVKGDPSASNIIKRMRLPHGDKQIMPPKESHKTMTEQEIAIVEKWVEQGAVYQKHWSIIPPEKQEPDSLKTISPDWAKNPIDEYTAARMEMHGLTPNPVSDPARLLRRMSLDITGLPPLPSEVTAFEEKFSQDQDKAVSDAADRLLSSDGYAENMTRHWLDAARYADTHGIHIDNKRDIWPYRDWVIRAFKDNMSFKQFTIEQLAGDLLPNPTLDQIVATGFSRCLPTTGEGGAIAEEYEHIYAQDRTDTTAAIYLGMTMGCAACHDHKFDPITQNDNYSFNAFFRNTTMPAIDRNQSDHAPHIYVPIPEDKPNYVQLLKDVKAIEAIHKLDNPTTTQNFQQWLTAQGTTPLENPKIAADTVLSLNVNDNQVHATVEGEKKRWKFKGETKSSDIGDVLGLKNTQISLGNILNFETKDQVSYGGYFRFDNNKPHGAILAKIDAKNKRRGWDIFADRGRFATHIIDTWPRKTLQVVTVNKLPVKEWVHVMVTYNGKAKLKERVTIYVNGESVPITYQKAGKIDNITNSVATQLGARDRKTRIAGGVALHSFEFFRRLLSVEEIADTSDIINKILRTAPTDRSPKDLHTLKSSYANHLDPYTNDLRKEKRRLKNEIRKIKSRGSKSLIMEEKEGEPYAYKLIRGEYSNKDMETGKLPAAVPSALPQMPEGAPKNRLGLAEWLVSKENPLTARVTMNRFWHYFFGEGIVTSTADFGIMGARPSHPKLLDYLAIEFIDQDWDIRHMIKLIVTSATYRQSQTITPEKKAIDAANTYLARGPRYRLDAEQIRDTALFASGLLNQKVGGPPVRPYQPDGVWQAVAMTQSNTRFYKPSKGSDLYRRSLYSFWKRTAPMANMEILNAPSREVFCVKRDRTNTPLQAFVTLNDTQFVEASRQLAQRALLSSEDFDARLDFITQALIARTFTSEERAIVKETLDENLSHYQKNMDAAQALIKVGESKPNTKAVSPDLLAAWTLTSNQVFNLDETLNK